jgi:hypothetical protein
MKGNVKINTRDRMMDEFQLQKIIAVTCASRIVKLCLRIIYSELSSQLGRLRLRANTITRCT